MDSSGSVTDGEEKAWVTGMAFETMAVLLAIHLEMWDISHIDDGEDPQKAKTALKAKGRRSEPSDPDHPKCSEITL